MNPITHLIVVTPEDLEGVNIPPEALGFPAPYASEYYMTAYPMRVEKAEIYMLKSGMDDICWFIPMDRVLRIA